MPVPVAVAMRGKVSPNMGRPLSDWLSSTSSWMTSQCSASLPSAMRTMSATTQLTGWPWLENRPCKMTWSPSATTSLMFVAQFWGQALDEVEQPAATGCDVGAVLDVVR